MNSDIKKQIDKLGSSLERAFDTQFQRLGSDLPTPEKGYVFLPDRKFHFDVAWPKVKIGVELHGGTKGYPIICHQCRKPVKAIKKDGSIGKQVSIPGHHARRNRFNSDLEKMTLAQLDGWIVLIFDHDDVFAEPFSMVEKIRKAFSLRSYWNKELVELSPRETEILHMIAGGLTGEKIAEYFDCGSFTISKHVANLVDKFGATNRTSACVIAAAWGLLDYSKIPSVIQISDK